MSDGRWAIEYCTRSKNQLSMRVKKYFPMEKFGQYIEKSHLDGSPTFNVDDRNRFRVCGIFVLQLDDEEFITNGYPVLVTPDNQRYVLEGK